MTSSGSAMRPQRPGRLSTVSVRFLGIVLPLLAVVSLAFMVQQALREMDSVERTVRANLEASAVNLSLLLSHPLWNFEMSTVSRVLEFAAQIPEVQCARLDHVDIGLDNIQLGNCDNVNELVTFSAPVIHADPLASEEPEYLLAHLELLADVEPDWGDVIGELNQLLWLALVLFLALTGTAVMGFRYTIIRPLSRVADAMREYSQSGVRHHVQWHSHDELGALIREYNKMIRHQQLAEEEAHQARQQAEEALAQVRQAQDELVQAEKLASLGRMVAGVAHEINTPVGNGLTAVSTLREHYRSFKSELDSGQVRRSSLSRYMDQCGEALQIMENNLQVAAEQIQHFKQVAVDQTSSQRRQFNLREVVDEVLYTLRPRLKRTRHEVEVEIPEDILMDSYPGPLGQVITNLVINSLLHGFEDLEAGRIRIQGVQTPGGDCIELMFEDNGKGVDQDTLPKLFDPFFTTRRGQGGSGLGLHLVYNIVTGILGGSVELDSTPGEGFRCHLVMPLSPQATKQQQQ